MLPCDASRSARMRVYLAAPLFSDSERAFNEKITEMLEKVLEVYLPQRDGGLMNEMIANGMSPEVSACSVFRRDFNAILDADFLIAILDGRSIDEGVAFELGVAYSHSKPCIGLQTDCRRLALWGNNPMITGALESVFFSPEELMSWVLREVSARALSYYPRVE